MSMAQIDQRLFWLPRVTLEPILLRIGLAMLASLALTLPALFLDNRTVQGDAIWVKPVKFQIALALYFLTLALYAGALPHRIIASPKMRLFLTAAALAAVAEMLWIGGAAMFGSASHYNTHPVMSAIYVSMGVVAVFLTSLCLVLGIAFWHQSANRGHDPLYLSVALGLILTFALTVPMASTLAALPDHHVGVPLTGAALPMLGWSTEVGDLRVAHFFAMHAMHAVPLVGLFAMLLPSRTWANRLVCAGALAYTALTLGTFVQALMERPFLS